MFKVFLFIFLSISGANILAGNTNEESALKAKARELAEKLIIVDSHVDLPYRLYKNYEDVSKSTKRGDFDYPRALSGGLNVPFMSVFVPARLEKEGGGKELADSLINIVHRIVKDGKGKFALAGNPDDVRNNFVNGIISLPMGIENGTPIEGDLSNVQYFYDRGIRYITLTHSKNNHIGDSSYEERKKHKGLSEFGKKLIPEMNRVGIMVDVSHVSDDTFWDVLEITKVPVIASHSSCRKFTPGFERNMDDDMINALAENGGVIQINFGSSFIDEEFRQKANKRRNHVHKYLREHGWTYWSEEGTKYRNEYYRKNPLKFPDVTKVVDHIDHVVNLVGINHVGLGSDFDGVGDSLPKNLKDVSSFPNLIYELLRRGYSEEEIEKICSGNIFRIWQNVENYAKNK